LNLEERLRERIRREGPISFYEWMKAALYDEREGYYCADRIRQGRAGDYRTAPETSPLFAATFANYFAKLCWDLQSPNPFTIVEVGSSSGEFAYGILSTLRSEHPQIFNATNYVIEEISSSSRELCAKRLSEFSDRVSFSSPTVGEGQVGKAALQGQASDKLIGIVFSNELIDAFPVNRVVMRNGQLRQLYVGLQEDSFVWIEAELEESVSRYCDCIEIKLAEGQIFEINLDAEKFIARAASLLDRGYIVSIDYGAERKGLVSAPDRRAGTLRSFRRHQFGNDVLARPGQQDLTTTIDWTQVIEAGNRNGMRAIRFERLDQFLIAEGLLDRLSAVSVTDAVEASRLTTNARELILPTGLAASFQVLVQEKT